ncbi:MAG: septum formation initiator family protein [Clostridia bacterium]|jgi:cell division protein FtsB|nr:septum formation initiator family protein [Clostridia bacterium]
MTENRLKLIVQFVTAVAVCFLFFVLIAITMQYIKLGELKSKQEALEMELNSLLDERCQLSEQVDYIQTEEYVEKYAREILGWGKSGETKFVAND